MVNHNITLKNVNIGKGHFRNFRGEKSEYNKAGNRKFTIILDEDTGRQLQDEGWKIKWWMPKNDDPTREPEPAIPLFEISLAFDERFPVSIKMVTGNDSVYLDEDNVGILDTAEIMSADIQVRPYNWDVNGNTGTKAYLKKLKVVIEDDDNW